MSVDVGQQDYTLLRDQLVLTGHTLAADVAGACTSAVVEPTIDGASTLTLTVPDHRRLLLRSGVLDDYLWAVVDGLHYQLVSVAKGTDVLTLTFEDAIVSALRQKKGTRTWEAASTTRDQMVKDMAAEVPVPVEVDPSLTGTVQAEVNRSKEGQEPTDSWSLTGSLASDITVRRFSTGRALVFGADDWLMSRYPVVHLSEPVRWPDGRVALPSVMSNADFTIDYGQASNSMTITVDADRWATPVGQGISLADMGPASGTWLVQSAPHTLGRARMQVQLARPTAALPEPKDDAGEFTFLPGETDVSGSSAGVVSTTAADHADLTVGSPRDKMIRFAKAQAGKPYVWGASGPGSFDCSGLVQAACQAAGKPLAKPARNQWNFAKSLGKVITVDEGLKTPGALLFRVGTSEGDHVVISLGDGTTVEARGKAYGCGVFPNAAHRHWTNAAIWV